MNIKISVIIIGFNIEKYIERCLNSVINQSLKDIEIIYIDDGSTDDTLSKVSKYTSMDKRISFYSQTNLGPYCARMKGLSYANGDYFIFVDGDDWIEKDMLQNLYKIITREKVKLLFFDYIKEDYKNNKKISNKLGLPANVKLNKKDILNLVSYKCMSNSSFSSPCNKIYERKFIVNINLPTSFEMKYGEDLFFLLKVYDCLPETYYTDVAYYHYCINNNTSLSQIHYDNAFFTIHKRLYEMRLPYARKWNCENDLYLNTAFIGISELFFDLKKSKKKMLIIKKYMRDFVFYNSVDKSKVKDYLKIFHFSKNFLMFVILKVLNCFY